MNSSNEHDPIAQAKHHEPHTRGEKALNTAVIVATHEYCYPLERCLTAFAAQTDRPTDVILVDNGSGGAVTAWAREHATEVSTVARRSNGYFCGGYNEGLRAALERGYEFALIVNADTEPCNPQLLADLTTTARRHPRAAFIGPMVFLRTRDNVQNTTYGFPSFLRNIVWFIAWKLLPRRDARGDAKERDVDFLNGVCVLCRLEAIREVGLLDEAMGGYMEDADWAWRARQLGWKSVYTPVPSIIHHQPETGYEQYSTKCFMLRRNTIYWHHKRGARMEAMLYGISARLLATARAAIAWVGARPDRDAFFAFAERLQRVDCGIRSDKPLGEWFGPPLSGL
jgi:GT2 family glycosyltransferase